MFDVVVVGARCAGAPLALGLARRGRRVLLVDKATFPSDTLSSHVMTPRGSSYLARLGVLDAVLATTRSFETMGVDIEGIRLKATVSIDALRARHRQLHGTELEHPSQKWISVRRRVLDKILVDAAAAEGVIVREAFHVEELLRDGDRVVGIRGRTKTGEIVEERAKVVVGADGRHSFVAKALALPRLHEQPSCSFCYWGYFSGFSIDNIGGPQLVQRGRLRAAIVPSHGDSYGVSIWGPGDWFPDFKANLDRNFLRTVEYCSPAIAELIRPSHTRTERLYGTADLGNFHRTAAGPGWALAGDAATAEDQCTAIGMTHALRDAHLFSESVADALDGGAVTIDAALRRYAERRDSDHLLAYHDYVCSQSKMETHSREELSLFAAMRGNDEAQSMTAGLLCDVVAPGQYFDPAHLDSIRKQGKESIAEYPLAVDESLHRRYQENPFRSERLDWRSGGTA